ncbi:MAG: hemolysin family protein [Pseudonocardia sp.]
MDGVVFNLALVVAFVLIGGFFAASELAVVSLRDSQVERLAATGRRGARVAALRTDSTRFLAAVQIGVTVAGFFSAAYGGSTLTEPFAGVLTGWGVPAGVATTVAFIAVTAFVSYLSLVLGELVPQRLALQKAESVAMVIAPVLDRVARISTPAVWLLTRSTNVVVRLLGLDPKGGGDEVSEEELRDLVAGHGDLGAEERRVLGDVFGAADRQLSAVLIPRTEVEFLDAAMPLVEAARFVLARPHSRYPVIRDTVDDVVGVVHVRDLLTAVLGSQGLVDAAGERTAAPIDEPPDTVGGLARPVSMLPGSKPLLSALSQLRADRTHLAVVVDEYGGTAGIVTMEDLLEELVGEIEDEYDPAGRPRDTTELDGLLNLDDVAERTGIHLPDGPYETLAGFVQARLRRVPAPDDTVEALGHRFTVTAMDRRRVARVRVAALPVTDPPGGQPERS